MNLHETQGSIKNQNIYIEMEVFLIFLFVRLASVYLVQTFFVPDEYWQSLEVAHNFAFKYGYLTWEWHQGIRSYIPPLVVAGYYKLLELIGINFVPLLVSIKVFLLHIQFYLSIILDLWPKNITSSIKCLF